ncbi:MAG TPA: R3H domain-containing nucleic acid-binding protein [Acidobacteriota bacterium]|nr:R3H domain-containing nucleic acid-binding protein [Acidobacteriota bacterium]
MTEQSEKLAAQVEKFMTELLGHMQLDVKMELEETDQTIEVRLSGADSEVILRNGARTLEAFNDIVNQIFYQPRDVRVEIDCEDYRLGRVLELELLARSAAEKTRVSGQSFRFQPMPPAERRTIHLTLAKEEGVRTESSGHGTNRHVVVMPA